MVEVKHFQAFDGRLFDNECDCADYERNLWLKADYSFPGQVMDDFCAKSDHFNITEETKRKVMKEFRQYLFDTSDFFIAFSKEEMMEANK